MCDMLQIFIPTTWSRWCVFGANKGTGLRWDPLRRLVACSWLCVTRDSAIEGGHCPLSACPPDALHLPPHHFSFLIFWFSISSDYIWFRNTSLWHLVVTASSAWMRKRTKCCHLLRKIKHENVSFFPLICYVIYISQSFHSLWSSEKLEVPNSLEAHSIAIYATTAAEYKTLHFMSVIYIIFFPCNWATSFLLPPMQSLSSFSPLLFCFQFLLNL